MKIRYIVLAALVSTSAYAKATDNTQTNYFCGQRFGIQGAIASGGALSIGVIDYTEYTELGLTISGTSNNASSQSNNVTPVLFAGLRYALTDQTYFAWGIDVADTFGTSNGSHIDADYQVGPYISIEQMLTKHVMLAGWIEPYQFGYEKLSGNSVSTNSYFGAGGLAINYLF